MTERLLKIAFSYIKKLPREKALNRGEDIASLLRFIKYREKVVKKNLDISFPEKDYIWKEEIYRKCISNIGRNIVEFPRIPDYFKTGFINEIFFIKKGKNILEKYRGKGGILVTGHLGNWEIAGSGLTAKGFPITALAYRQKSKEINQIIEKIRINSGLKIIYHDQNLKTFLKALSSGQFIAFLVDQNALRHRGTFVNFFNLKASTVTFPAKLALKYKKPILFSYCIFDEKRKVYETFIEEIDISDKETVETLTQKYTKAVEEAVRKFPSQYLWTHKRWKTRPEGEKEFY